MSYVDGFVVPVPIANLAAYKKMSRKCGKIWREHGALAYFECVGDDVPVVPAFASPLVSPALVVPAVVVSAGSPEQAATRTGKRTEG